MTQNVPFLRQGKQDSQTAKNRKSKTPPFTETVQDGAPAKPAQDEQGESRDEEVHRP